MLRLLPSFLLLCALQREIGYLALCWLFVGNEPTTDAANAATSRHSPCGWLLRAAAVFALCMDVPATLRQFQDGQVPQAYIHGGFIADCDAARLH
jgi:hypothetical protein